MLIEKIKTSFELYQSFENFDEKLNFFKCLFYNLKPQTLKKNKINFLPLSASIYINTICNYRCSFCFLINEDHKGSKKMNMDTLTFNKIINSDFLKFAKRITLGGGEPYLNKNIFEFIKILKYKKKIISIYTNGSLINRNYENFIENQPTYMNISHYDDKFEDLKENFKKYNNDPKKTSISRLSKIIRSDNLDNMEFAINEALDANFDRIIFQNYFPYKSEENYLVLQNNNKKFKELKVNLNNKYSKKIKIIWPNILNMRKKFNCNNISTTTTIDSNGNLAKCCFLTPPHPKDGNIFKPVKEVWNSAELQNFRGQYGKTEVKKECQYCYFKNGLDNRTL